MTAIEVGEVPPGRVRDSELKGSAVESRRRLPTTARWWHTPAVKLSVETEKEVDGRWIAAIDPVGALAYGATKAEAIRKAKAIALEVLADRLNAGESAATGRKTRRPTTFSELHFVA
jgi:hypothetical protein